MYKVKKSEQFDQWLEKLKDRVGKSIILARLTAAEQGKLGDWGPIEGGLSELRIHFGPGYRLYFVRRKDVILVMLAGGIKSTQIRDIQKALKLINEIEIKNDKG
jgi:putative addiction module killer protein